jgi:hypothetical protein
MVGAQNEKTQVPSLEERKEAYESTSKKSKSPEVIAMDTAKKLSQKLKLSEDQTRKVYEVILKTDKELSSINKSQKNTREKSMAINKANKEKLNAFEKIMTPAQFRDYRLSFP